MKFDRNNIPKESLDKIFTGSNAVLEALHFITRNNLRLEHRKDRSSDRWEECSIRRFVYYMTTKGYKSQDDAKLQNYLAWYRIKQPRMDEVVENQVLIPREERI